MKKLIYIVTLTILGFQLKGQSPESLIKQANQLYSDAKYEEAVTLYDSVIQSGYEAAEIYYNLGNTYYKLKNIPYSILNYERALLLNPGDEDVQYNLNLVKTMVVDKIETIPDFFLTKWRKNLVRSLPSNIWALISISGFIIMLILAIMYFFTTSSSLKKLSFWLGAVFILVTVVTLSFARQHKRLLTNHNTAIIVEPSIVVKSSPDESGSDLFFLHEGTKVKVEDHIGNWREIKISDGNKGWILAEGIEMI